MKKENPTQNPFPYEWKDKVIHDEIRTCGARRSEHMNTLAFGHGSCPKTNCIKFTWKSFIETEK